VCQLLLPDSSVSSPPIKSKHRGINSNGRDSVRKLGENLHYLRSPGERA
jgi:hypothetical protein